MKYDPESFDLATFFKKVAKKKNKGGKKNEDSKRSLGGDPYYRGYGKVFKE